MSPSELKGRIMVAVLRVLEDHKAFRLDIDTEMAIVHNKLCEAILKEIDAYLDDQ